MLLIDKVRLFDHLLEQHASEAALLWSQRALAVNQVNQSLTFLHRLETRLIKHLHGLLLAPDHAWDIARSAVDDGGSGELFVLTILAFHHNNARWIEQVLALGEQHKASFPGLISACAWLAGEKIHPFLRPWLESDNTWLRYLAITVCSLRRLDPRHHLESILRQDESFKPLCSRALRLAGELKRADLLPLICERRSADDDGIHFWGHWAALLLGEGSAMADFESYVLQPGDYQLRAIHLAMRCQGVAGRELINILAQSPEQHSSMIIALSALGDPGSIDWLLERMTEPAVAPLAGYAFSMLTGVDLTDDSLVLPYDPDRDDDYAMEAPDGYMHVKYPRREALMDYWSRNKHHFIAGQRYFMGQTLSPDVLKHVLCHGLQGQREAAAMELAVLDQPGIYSNTRQPGVKLNG